MQPRQRRCGIAPGVREVLSFGFGCGWKHRDASHGLDGDRHSEGLEVNNGVEGLAWLCPSAQSRVAFRYAGKKAGRISDMQLLSDELPSLRRGDVCVAVKAVRISPA